MRPFFWNGTRNFGDYMNAWLWPKIIPDLLSDCDNIRLIGIGSLLKDSLNLITGTKVIFGTGCGYGNIPHPDAYKTWRFYFVRGPLTARCFNLTREKSIVDGAWLISQVPEYRMPVTEKRGVAFIPHWTSANSGAWEQVCGKAGMKYVNPEGNLLDILECLRSSELVLTESLHGAILADYFRTPWTPLSISPKFLPFKWHDWFQSVDAHAPILRLPYSDAFDHFYNGAMPSECPEQCPEMKATYELPSYAQINQTQTAGRLYKLKIDVKQRLRTLRSGAVARCKSLRNSVPLRRWNEHHQNRLASIMKDIAGKKPALSSTETWNEKCERLAEVTACLKSDYAHGRINAQ